MVALGKPVPKGGGVYKVGKPYQINGRWFHPREDSRYDKVGVASWYGELFHGRYTANGEIYDMNALTAAHPTLPLPTYARVTNLGNGRSLVVRVNDRGPYAHDRIIDMSKRSAELLGFKRNGTTQVRVRYLARAPLSGDDTYERQMLASQRWARTAGLTGPPRSSAAPDWKPLAAEEGAETNIKVAAAPSRNIAAEPAPSNLPPGPAKQAKEAATRPESLAALTPPEPAGAPMNSIQEPAVEADPIITASIPKPAIGAMQKTANRGDLSPKKKKLYVQTGAFRLLSNAERLRTKLSALGRTEISQTTVAGSTYHRVRLGPFDAEDLADATLKDVVRAGASGASIVTN